MRKRSREHPTFAFCLETVSQLRSYVHELFSQMLINLSPSINDNKARDQWYQGTGHWFLEGEAFDRFKKGSVPFLWLYGIPGCGKTIMTSSIIRSLENSSSDPPCVVLYFYFDSNDIISKQTLDGAVRSLLWQVSYHAGGCSPEVEQLYGQCDEGRRQPPTQDLLSALEKSLRGFGRVNLVLDALDECKFRPNLLLWLTKLTAAGLSNVQIIATSREEHDIKTALEKLVPSDARISMDHLAVDPDIRAYVRRRVRRDTDLKRWQDEPEVQAAIETQLMEKASGM
jgi:Cdc6-like AAA superfamily ATPase